MTSALSKSAMLGIVALSLGLAAALPASAAFGPKDLQTFDGPGFGPRDLPESVGPAFGPSDLPEPVGPAFGPSDVRTFDGPAHVDTLADRK